MYIKIFQIDRDKDNNRLWLCALDTVKRVAGRVPREIYDMVYEGDVPCSDLEAVYTMFKQADHPNKDTVTKLHVSDVVAICNPKSGAETYYYCNHIGFEKIRFQKLPTK